MGATLEWDCIPFILTTPQGQLPLNTQDALGVGEGGYYLIRRDASSMGAPLRVSVDDVPQDDGSLPHKVLTAGYEVMLALELWQDATHAATGETLVAMNDLLMRHLNRIRDDGLGRLSWNPSGANLERMVDDLWWTEDVSPENGGGDDLLWMIKFGMKSPFPYAQALAELTTSIADGATETLDNTGTARFFPVIKVYGATSEFTIENAANGKEFHYDAAQPGGVTVPGSGGYVELDFFRNTAYINGNAANAKASIDVVASDFFPLEIGENDLTIDGAHCDVLWQPAFA